nr:unnamed protein product [Callosobruchus analis]
MHLVCLLLALVWAGIDSAADIDDLPANFPRCHRDDPELGKCMLQATETVRPYVIEGVPNFSKSVVNFTVPNVVLQDGNQAINYRADVNDMVLYGLENYKFEYLNFFPDNLTYTSRVVFPYIYIEGNYKLKGNIFFAPLSGHGAFHVNVSETSCSTIQTNKLVTRNGNEYLEPLVSAPKLKVGRVMDYKFEGLFVDSADLAKVAKHIIDENMGLIVQELMPVINKIVVTCWITFISCGAPEVYEEVEEHPVNIRTVRNPKDLHDKVFYEPPVFNYRNAKQQDSLRAKYAQQQRVDLARYYRNLRNNKAEMKTSWLESDEDWKPFSPKVRKVRERGAKDYHANDTKYEQAQNGENRRTLERKDSYIANAEIIYLHPNLLGNPQGAQLNALSDLIGKNPNVQLEGLKRLLKMNGQQSHTLSTLKQPQQFQQPQVMSQAHFSQQPAQFPQHVAQPPHHNEELPTSITDDDVKNGALERLQSHLNEVARKQAEEMLIRAQHQAKAQVEAQYKAIEATRQAMIEKAKHTMQQTTIAVPALDSDQDSQEYQSTPSPHHDVVLVPQPSPIPAQPIVPLQEYYTTPEPEQQYILVPEPTAAPVEEQQQESYRTPSPGSKITSQGGFAPKEQEQVVWVTQTPSPFMVSTTAAPLILSSSNPNHHEPLPTPAAIIHIPETYERQQNPQKPTFSLKNILYENEHAKHYAPKHQHLVIEQAKKALVAQIKDQNRAILSKNRLGTGTRKPTQAYQGIILEPQHSENVQKIYGHEDGGENYDEVGEGIR